MSGITKGFTWVHMLISILFGMGALTYIIAIWQEVITGADTYVIFATIGALVAFMTTFAAIFVERRSSIK